MTSTETISYFTDRDVEMKAKGTFWNYSLPSKKRFKIAEIRNYQSRFMQISTSNHPASSPWHHSTMQNTGETAARVYCTVHCKVEKHLRLRGPTKRELREHSLCEPAENCIRPSQQQAFSDSTASKYFNEIYRKYVSLKKRSTVTTTKTKLTRAAQGQ